MLQFRPHPLRGIGLQQRSEFLRAGSLLAQAFRPGLAVENHGHTLVDRGDQVVGRTDDDAAGANPFGARPALASVLPEAGEEKERLVSRHDCIGLFASRRLLPFIEAAGRDEAASPGKGIAKGRKIRNHAMPLAQDLSSVKNADPSSSRRWRDSR